MSITRVTPVNRSGTISTGGAAQVLMAANSGRFKYMIRNVGVTSLWFSTTGTATADHNAFELKPDEYFETPDDFCPGSAISIIGATTGQAFFAEEW